MAKITETELKRIELIRHESLEVASILGELSFQKIVLDNHIEEQKQRILDIKKRENTILEEFKDKYGNVTINIETGEINQ